LVINYLDIDGLLIRDGVNYNLTPNGLFAGDRDVIMNDLFMAGQSYNRGKIKERKMTLTGYVMGDILTNLNKLKQVLFKDGLKKMTVGIVGMPTFYIYFDLLNWGCDEVNPQLISCQLVAPDPFLYESVQRVINLGATSNANLVLPAVLPWMFGSLMGGQGTITNAGNAIAYPIITIVGTCDTITITNTTTGESMSLNISLGASDTLVIDNRPSTRGIYLNGTKRMDLKNGNWLSCQVGDNVFTFSRNSLETKQHCSIILQSRWI
jgi:hypothetical protein